MFNGDISHDPWLHWETNPNGHQGAVGSEFKIDASYVSPNARDLDMLKCEDVGTQHLFFHCASRSIYNIYILYIYNIYMYMYMYIYIIYFDFLVCSGGMVFEQME